MLDEMTYYSWVCTRTLAQSVCVRIVENPCIYGDVCVVAELVQLLLATSDNLHKHRRCTTPTFGKMFNPSLQFSQCRHIRQHSHAPHAVASAFSAPTCCEAMLQ